MSALLKIYVVELAFVQETEVVLFCYAVYPSRQAEIRRGLGKGDRKEGKGDARFEIWQIGHKFGHILHRVFGVEMVSVAIVLHAWPMSCIKLDAIDVVPKF